MVEKLGLNVNRWVIEIYAKHKRWVEAYLREVDTVELMSIIVNLDTAKVYDQENSTWLKVANMLSELFDEDTCSISMSHWEEKSVSYTMRIMQWILQEKFYEKYIMNLTYHIMMIANMRNCSLKTLLNCVTYHFISIT